MGALYYLCLYFVAPVMWNLTWKPGSSWIQFCVVNCRCTWLDGISWTRECLACKSSAYRSPTTCLTGSLKAELGRSFSFTSSRFWDSICFTRVAHSNLTQTQCPFGGWQLRWLQRWWYMICSSLVSVYLCTSNSSTIALPIFLPLSTWSCLAIYTSTTCLSIHIILSRSTPYISILCMDGLGFICHPSRTQILQGVRASSHMCKDSRLCPCFSKARFSNRILHGPCRRSRITPPCSSNRLCLWVVEFWLGLGTTRIPGVIQSSTYPTP